MNCDSVEKFSYIAVRCITVVFCLGIVVLVGYVVSSCSMTPYFYTQWITTTFAGILLILGCVSVGFFANNGMPFLGVLLLILSFLLVVPLVFWPLIGSIS